MVCECSNKSELMEGRKARHSQQRNMVEQGKPWAFHIYLDKPTPPPLGEMPSTWRTESHVSMGQQVIFFFKCLEITYGVSAISLIYLKLFKKNYPRHKWLVFTVSRMQLLGDIGKELRAYKWGEEERNEKDKLRTKGNKGTEVATKENWTGIEDNWTRIKAKNREMAKISSWLESRGLWGNTCG